MLLCLANIGDVMADIFRFIYTKICCCGCCRQKPKNKVSSLQQQDSRTPEAWKTEYEAHKGLAMNQKAPVIVDDDEEDDDLDEDKMSVPLTITMSVIAGYIFMGALLFGVLEKWDPLKASYFCFITISTIGFGDVVPGSATFETTSDQYKMIAAAIYMLFGMAILSMCFSLMQEEIVAKFRYVGEKIGIIEKEGGKGEEDDNDPNNEQERSPSTQKPQQTPRRMPLAMQRAPPSPHGPPKPSGRSQSQASIQTRAVPSSSSSSEGPPLPGQTKELPQTSQLQLPQSDLLTDTPQPIPTSTKKAVVFDT